MRNMRNKVIAIVIIILFLGIGSWWKIKHTPVNKFRNNSVAFFQAYAKSCDDILVHYATSNLPITLQGMDFKMLPSIISTQDTDRVVIYSNTVAMMLGPGKMGGFSVRWERNYPQSRQGHLIACDGVFNYTLY